MKMSCATFKATTEIPQWPPLPKGAGRRTGGFFAFDRHFHKRRKAREVRNNKQGKNFACLAAWRDKVF
jgi:hypothetical protein